MTRNESEHSPMSGLDEYPIHQLSQPMRVVHTSDPRAYERYWFTAQDPAGELFLVQGLGTYPNLDTAEAYAIVIHDGQHVAVRAHRLLGDDRADMKLGPLALEVIEPFREWRLTLDANAQNVTYDLRWRDRKRAVFQRMGGGRMATQGRVLPELCGYETFGTVEGVVEFKGHRVSVDGTVYRGSRDHHWGTRDGVGGRIPGLDRFARRRTHCGQWVEFEDWSIWGWRNLYNLGDPRPGAGTVQPVEHRMKFDPTTSHLVGGVIVNRMGDGQMKEVRYEQIRNCVAYLRCGAYPGGPAGGSPEEDLFHGMYPGDDLVWGKTYDLTDPKVRMHLAGFDDHLCLATCDGESTVGILECMNPLLYEMCRDQVPGFAFL